MTEILIGILAVSLMVGSIGMFKKGNEILFDISSMNTSEKIDFDKLYPEFTNGSEYKGYEVIGYTRYFKDDYNIEIIIMKGNFIKSYIDKEYSELENAIFPEDVFHLSIIEDGKIYKFISN